MKYHLIKCSAPGWIKEFKSEVEARHFLFNNCICSLCTEGDEETGYEPIDINSSIWSMLSTSCGCEYDYEEIDNEQTDS